jgi:hypothetical protein
MVVCLREFTSSTSENSVSPTIVDFVVYDFLSVGWNLHYELNGLAVDFLKRI